MTVYGYLRCLVLLGLVSVAHAQTSGSWSARIGIAHVAPDVSSGNLSAPSIPGSKVDVSADTQLGGGLNYTVNDHFAIDLPIALPLHLDITGDGSLKGVGQLGQVRVLPVTLLGQYRFLEPASQWRPYIGAGLTYAKFYRASGTPTLNALNGGAPTGLSVQSKAALSLQAGVSISLNAKWFVDLSYMKTFLKTNATLSSGQAIDIKLNPDAYGMALGYKF